MVLLVLKQQKQCGLKSSNKISFLHTMQLLVTSVVAVMALTRVWELG